jgi:hypothetical protein
MILAGMAASSMSHFYDPDETRNDCGLQAFRGQRALSVLQPWHRKKSHTAPVAVVNSMNYEK